MLKRLIRFEFTSYIERDGNDTTAYDSFARYVADMLQSIKQQYPAANDLQICGRKMTALDGKFLGNKSKVEMRILCAGTADAYNTVIDHWDELDPFNDYSMTYVELLG